SYFNGRLYIALGNTPEIGFDISNFFFPAGVPVANRTAIYTSPSFNTITAFGSRGTTATISANRTSNPIIWNTSVSLGSTDKLVAFDTSANTLFSSNWTISGQGSSTSNTLENGVANATGVKFSIPTVYNGMVYVGTGAGAGTSGHAQGTIVG